MKIECLVVLDDGRRFLIEYEAVTSQSYDWRLRRFYDKFIMAHGTKKNLRSAMKAANEEIATLAEEKREAGKDRVLLVTRDCCTSGNCGTCIAEEGHKFGDRVRVCQYITKSERMAMYVRDNFAGYNSKVEEAIPDVVVTLCGKAKTWVEEKLAHPETISTADPDVVRY